MRKLVFTPYNQQWPSLFREEAKKIKKIFGNELIEIYHIGSTSINRLHAKPIIDMMPVVRNIKHVDLYNGAMTKLGYICKGENGIPGRRYFQKGGDIRTHHVHVYENGNPHIERHLAFRNYLREHPQEAKAYGELKRKLAECFPNDITSYIKGKEALAIDIETRALEWMRQQ
ncbi:GrpB family protein [Halalkalibacter urbisdiaboli]|uniref:GrpB family protein n=1 Tax=Halalkalibacter urbisdiaboli TaxID=1960589 RepID=UPI000B44B7F9|nr:GrpB family protein [Halalkalibacter urbisdiaboli]